MVSVKNLYFLSVTQRENNEEEAEAFRSKPLKQWIAELPTANYGMTTRLFHDKVLVMNKTEMDVGVMLDALDLLYPTYNVIYEFLVSRIVNKGFPLTPDDQKVGQLAETVTKDFFTSHWILLEKLLSNKSPGWRQGKAIPVYIERILSGLSQILIVRYLLHIPTPDWIWLDIHSLYRLAEEKGKEAIKIKENSKLFGSQATIALLYKQILLLCLADPYGMNQREILEIYYEISNWGSAANLLTTVPTQDKGLCVVYLDEDKPPVWEQSLDNLDDSDSRFMILELSPLVQKLSGLMQSVDPTIGRFDLIQKPVDGSLTVSHSLLEYLLDQWSGNSAEPMTLYQDKKPRLLSIGLKATHQQLNPPTNPEEKILGDWLVTINDDQSMRCEFDQAEQISIGSLVSSKRVDIENAKRIMGVVRRIWMERLDGAVHFEILVLTSQVIAAGIQPIKAKKDLQVYQRVLLFFTDSEVDKKGRVILETQKLKNGSRVQLLMQSDTVTVALNNRCNVGIGYTQFDCTPIAEEKREILPPQGYDFL